MAEVEKCPQCDQPVVVGALVNPGTTTEGRYHYDCLPHSIAQSNPYMANAADLARKGTRDEALQAVIFPETAGK